MNTEQNYVGKGDSTTSNEPTATPNAQAANTQAQNSPIADSRQTALQALTLIVERDKQWLAALRTQPIEVVTPLVAFIECRINGLNDSIQAFSFPHEELSTSANKRTHGRIRRLIKKYIKINLSAHQQACTLLIDGLTARGFDGINLSPVSL